MMKNETLELTQSRGQLPLTRDDTEQGQAGYVICAKCANAKSREVRSSFSDSNKSSYFLTHFPRTMIRSTRKQPLNKINLARVSAVDTMVNQNWKFGDGPGVPS